MFLVAAFYWKNRFIQISFQSLLQYLIKCPYGPFRFIRGPLETFLYQLKRLENLWFSDLLRWYKKRPVASRFLVFSGRIKKTSGMNWVNNFWGIGKLMNIFGTNVIFCVDCVTNELIYCCCSKIIWLGYLEPSQTSTIKLFCENS